MIRLAARLSVIPILAMACSFAHAQQHDEYIYGMASYVDPDSGLTSDDGVGGQAGLGWALNDYWNWEVYLQRTRTGGTPKLRDASLGVDLQLLLNREGRLSPYLFAGASTMSINSDVAARDREGSVQGGAGLRARIFGDSRAALRIEYRVRGYDYLGTDLEDNLISLGLQLPFGDAQPKFVDSDGDGAADAMDRCPNTPAGTRVGTDGCEIDSDGDGVADSLDQCANTPRGTSVDSNGCPTDSDGDGVSDGEDECPNTVRGAPVDNRGCELDSDDDGVVDRLDRCPNTARGVQVDIAGCEIKDAIELPGVNFESNSDRLLPGAADVLNAAAATLQKNPEISVEVEGHTDSDGTAEYNESLSERRANTVRDYLIGRGVPANRVTANGYGESQPIADNGTAVGKAANRRVVLGITAR